MTVTRAMLSSITTTTTALIIVLLLAVGSVESFVPTTSQRRTISSLRFVSTAPSIHQRSSTDVFVPPPTNRRIENNERKWDLRFEQLEEFKRRQGHCNPDPEHDFHLAMWTKNQRMNYKYYVDGTRKSSLTSKRVGLLNSIEFVWSVHDAKWTKMYLSLAEFHQTHGHCDVPSCPSRNCQSSKLARWVTQQRLRYKRAIQHDYCTASKSRPLTTKQMDLLEQINFSWHPRDTTWWKRYNELKLFQEIHGHCFVPQRYIGNLELGTWSHHQRRACKEYVLSCMIEQQVKDVYVSGLTEDRLTALREIDFCWLPDPSERFEPPPVDILDSWYAMTRC